MSTQERLELSYGTAWPGSGWRDTAPVAAILLVATASGLNFLRVGIPTARLAFTGILVLCAWMLLILSWSVWRRERPRRVGRIGVSALATCVSLFAFLQLLRGAASVAMAMTFGSAVAMDPAGYQVQSVLSIDGAWSPPTSAYVVHAEHRNWPDESDWYELHVPPEHVSAFEAAVLKAAADHPDRFRVARLKQPVSQPFGRADTPDWLPRDALPDGRFYDVYSLVPGKPYPSGGLRYEISAATGTIYVYSW